MNTESVCFTLGLTQMELAILLRVTRSQVAMFATGKRSLPIEAMKKLVLMLAAANDAKKLGERKQTNSDATVLRKKHLDYFLREKEYALIMLEKKIEALERKETLHSNLTQIVSHAAASEGVLEETHRQMINHKSSTVSLTSTGSQMIKLQIRKELLELELNYLKSQSGM